jgi:hypothetical protein
VGLVLTRHRRVLLTPGPWLSVIIAGLVFLPHLLWQVAHDWPMREFMSNATSQKMAAVSPVEFVVRQIRSIGFGSALVWIPGLIGALMGTVGAGGRPLSLLYLSVAALLITGGRSRVAYLAVAYPMLFAAGGVVWERIVSRPPWARGKPVLVALVVLLNVVWLPIVLPILPVDTFIRYQAALGIAPSTEERHRMGPLSQHYADMFGWDEMVAEVARVYRTLTPEEQSHAVVFGQNYGEAGAVEVLGRRHGLPPAISSHNSYWLWGPGRFDGKLLVVIGGDSAEGADLFERWERRGTITSRYAMPYESGLGVYVGWNLEMPPAELWPRLKHYD